MDNFHSGYPPGGWKAEAVDLSLEVGGLCRRRSYGRGEQKPVVPWRVVLDRVGTVLVVELVRKGSRFPNLTSPSGSGEPPAEGAAAFSTWPRGVLRSML